MSVFEAIVLGLVQGLTEFLPISSSGHLLIVPAMAGWGDPGAAFTAVIQLGTMAAVLMFFRIDLMPDRPRLARTSSASRSPSAATRPTSAGSSSSARSRSRSSASSSATRSSPGARSLYLVGTMLIAFSFVMLAAERFGAARPAAQGDQRPRRHLHRHLAGLRPDPRASRAPGRRSRPACSGTSTGPRQPATRSCSRSRRSCSAASSSSRTSAARAASASCRPRWRRSSPSSPATPRSPGCSATWRSHSLAIFVAYRIPLGILVIALAASGAITS